VGESLRPFFFSPPVIGDASGLYIMKTSRREFLSRSVGAGAALGLALPDSLAAAPSPGVDPEGAPRVDSVAPLSSATPSISRSTPQTMGDQFDPWVEVDPEALGRNTATVARLVNGRPILAVIKNNAYGLGLTDTARLLSAHAAIHGFAVVKPGDAIALRDSGVEGPILLMGMAPDDAVRDLVEAGVTLSLYLDDDAKRLPARVGPDVSIRAHVYMDTGMSRMGIPYHRVLPWLRTVAETGRFDITGAYMAFAEDADFDRLQLQRFNETVDAARAAGTSLGSLHAASSNGVYHLPDGHLDMVRPGIALFGGYPSRPEEEMAIAPLRPAFALKCRVVRVEQLREGDGVSYGRNYVAERPTWIATLPAGHVDGYPRTAVDGGRVAINGASYPVIGAVSASHMIIEIGDDPVVTVGDIATLMGADHPDVHPNELARTSSSSVYDLFMHLNPSLPRHIL